LEQCGILNYIKTTVFGDNSQTSNSEEKCREPKRMKQNHDEDVSDNKYANNKWAYCDLGCNEGDLSLALSSDIIAKECADGASMYCLGLDIDKELIKRAQAKKKSCTNQGKIKDVLQFNAEFHECNLNDAKDHLEKTKLFLKQVSVERFNLTSIFSTTMWIHIHSGDDGLVSFLERACSMTNYLLVEPQPSKCYRSVNIRLRRMNRPEEDISVERLKMRSDMEGEIDRVVKSFGFERVVLPTESSSTSGESDREISRTKWKRNLQIYRRIEL
jgi:hypothetical protein